MKKKIISGLLVLYAFSAAYAQPQTASHAMYKGNSALTGVYKEDPLYNLSGVAFKFPTGGSIHSTVCLDGNTAFFGSGDGNVYAVNSVTGKELWRFATGGAVTSSPAVNDHIVYFSSRDGNLYALATNTGKELWKYHFNKDVPANLNYWDYYLSSPNIVGDRLYIGSGDGHIYAFGIKDHRVKWSFNAKSRIRTTPAIDGNTLVFGTMDGHIRSLNRDSGTLKWIFATDGASIPFERDENDRTSIYCSPSIAEGMVVVGGRDGFGYGIDLKTGKQKWKVDHNGSWVLSTAIKDGVAYLGSGSERFVQALDLQTGVEKWKFKTQGHVFSSISITGPLLYFGDFFGNIYAVDRSTGQKKWMFPLGYRVFSTPVVSNGKLYCSSDEGILTVINGSAKDDQSFKAGGRKVVYWEGKKTDTSFVWYTNNTDLLIRDYFKTAGYELMNEAKLKEFIVTQINSKIPSLVVFADNKIPASIVESQTESATLRRYLNANGKIVFFGDMPLFFKADVVTGVVASLDYDRPKNVLSIQYPQPKEMKGYYSSSLTPSGKALGLIRYLAGGLSPVPAEQVTTVLAKDEFGLASGWLKVYGTAKGTGVMQLSLPRNLGGSDIYVMRAAIEYGIEW